MSILITILLCGATGFIGYVFGKFKGVDEYHDYLLREGKIVEK